MGCGTALLPRCAPLLLTTRSSHVHPHTRSYLNSALDGDFEGGDLLFAAPREDAREEGREEAASEGHEGRGVPLVVRPAAGTAVVFSSGWENPHSVTPLRAGVRVNLPVFFTTQPPNAKRASWRGSSEGAPPCEEERARLLWRLVVKPGWATAEREADFGRALQSWAALVGGEIR